MLDATFSPYSSSASKTRHTSSAMKLPYFVPSTQMGTNLLHFFLSWAGRGAASVEVEGGFGAREFVGSTGI